MITKRSHFNLSANLFLPRWNTLGVLFLLLISVLFTSCFSDLKTSQTTSVNFSMSRETIQKILGKTETGRSADSAARDAGDAADPLEATYIDVTLYAVEKQTKTAVISVKSDLNMTFDEVPVGASVYAKAKIYKYLDAGQTQRDVIYNGESSRIVVHNGQNALNLKLAGAMLTITFNSNGGSSVSSKKVATGTTVENIGK